MPKKESGKVTKSQVDKFREAAQELGTDDSEKAFDGLVRRIAKSPPPKESPKKGQRD